jgi:hypothetical protein
MSETKYSALQPGRVPRCAEEIPNFEGVARFYLQSSDGKVNRFGHAEGNGSHLLFLADRVEAVGLVLSDYANSVDRTFCRASLDDSWVLHSSGS